MTGAARGAVVLGLALAGIAAQACTALFDFEDFEEKELLVGDYSACDPSPINNQMVVCDSMLNGVEEYCGFSLTVDPCVCSEEVADCTAEVDWLGRIMACYDSSSDCGGYIDCLEAAGEGDECDCPAEWGCIVTK